MKLRNKKTGEIKECAIIPIVDGYVNEYEVFEKAKSLTELNEEWEDYEEPKTFWYIRCSGEVYEDESDDSTEHGEKHKSIGNYFETKEEAEKAVEKLKAWKRLKDKGFRFSPSHSVDAETIHHRDVITCHLTAYFDDKTERENLDTEYDLDLLFGGEE